MLIKIGRTTSEKNRLTKNFTQVAELNATIKEGTSIVNPVFIIHAQANPGTLNYVKAPDWNRNYHILDITALPGERLALKCHVDVLTSFASSIKACQVLVDKQQKDSVSSKYIDDGSYVTECDDVIQCYTYSKSFNNSSTIVITAGGQ